MGEIYNRYLEFSPLLGVKIVRLVDRTDLFTIFFPSWRYNPYWGCILQPSIGL